MGWADALTATANAGLGLGNFAYNVVRSERARRDYERHRREDWAREDNAIQRRVEDMRLAGINPVLAAGQPAASQATASHNEPSELNAPNLLQLITMREAIHNTRAERQRIKAETESIRQGIEESKSRQSLYGTQERHYAQGIDLAKQQHAFNEISNPLDIETRQLRNRIDSAMHNLQRNRAETENAMLRRQNEIGQEFDKHMAELSYQRTRNQHQLDEINLQIRRVDRTIKERLGLSTAVAQEAATELANEILRHNLQFARNNNLPVNSAIPGIAGQLAWLVETLEKWGLGITEGR